MYSQERKTSQERPQLSSGDETQIQIKDIVTSTKNHGKAKFIKIKKFKNGTGESTIN